jgi:FkbM family methyltransferase
MKVQRNNIQFEVNENPQYTNFWISHYSRDWELDTSAFISTHLNKHKTYIDIGAWIGPHAIPASFNSKEVICFEPDKVAREELLKNIQCNSITNMYVEDKAVSIHSSISLGASELGESITRDSCTENSFEVKCMTVNDIFDRYQLTPESISIIKIDIEGHEAELLQDPFLINLNVPMHVSIHFPFATNKDEFSNKISPFFAARGIDVAVFDRTRNIDISIYARQ